MTAPLDGQAHLTVPLAGGPPGPDAAARITRTLQQLWVRNPLTAGRRITSVAATIVQDSTAGAPAPHRLILLLTYDRPESDAESPLDSAPMAKHLEDAIAALA